MRIFSKFIDFLHISLDNAAANHRQSSKMVNYKVSSRAYAKMILHAAKYPHCAINGLLLTSATAAAANGTIEIVDVLPLFHQCLHVSPMAEIALLQADALVGADKLQIGGYYAACELLQDKTVEKAPGGRIADRIAENNAQAAFIVIDNVAMGSGGAENGPALNLWQNKDGHWAHASVDNLDETLDAVDLLVERGAAKDLQDFDNHLDNLKNDWTNEHFNQDLQKLLAMY